MTASPPVLADTQPSVLGDPEDPWSYHKETVPADVPVRLLPQFVQLTNSEDPNDQLQGTLLIRKLLCGSKDPPWVDQIVESQVVPRLISFMQRDDVVNLQLEAVWAVTNVASSGTSHIHYVMEQGAVPHFIRHLNSPSEAIREKAAWALGNISGESATCRDNILGHGVMAPLLQCITTPAEDVRVLRNGVWVVSNLCRSKPSPDLDTVCRALPVIVPLLNHDDEEIVSDACWALSYISDAGDIYRLARVERVLNTGALPQIIRLLSSVHASPATRLVGNIASGSSEQTQLLVSSGALPPFHALLEHPSPYVKKEACFALSNIIAETTDQIQAVMDEDLFPGILQCVCAVENDVKKEALWCVANVATDGTTKQVRYLVEELNAFNSLTQVLACNDTKILTVALDGLLNLLATGDDEKERRDLAKNPYAQLFINEGGLKHLEKLERHTNNNIHFSALSIVDDFFERADGSEVSAVGSADPEDDHDCSS